MAKLLVSTWASICSAHVRSGDMRAVALGEQHVDRAQLGGEGGDRLGVANVEHAGADLGAGALDARGRRLDPAGVAAGEVHDMAGIHAPGESLGERESEALVGPGDQGCACHTPRR